MIVAEREHPRPRIWGRRTRRDLAHTQQPSTAISTILTWCENIQIKFAETSRRTTVARETRDKRPRKTEKTNTVRDVAKTNRKTERISAKWSFQDQPLASLTATSICRDIARYERSMQEDLARAPQPDIVTNAE